MLLQSEGDNIASMYVKFQALNKEEKDNAFY